MFRTRRRELVNYKNKSFRGTRSVKNGWITRDSLQQSEGMAEIVDDCSFCPTISTDNSITKVVMKGGLGENMADFG